MTLQANKKIFYQNSGYKTNHETTPSTHRSKNFANPPPLLKQPLSVGSLQASSEKRVSF